MSDAREIVQPRWKRRATEIAEAIGGSGVSSVSLDETTINNLSQAIADAIELKTLDINIKTYSGVDYGTAGMPIQQGYSAVNGNRLSFHVAQQGTVDINVKEYNDVSVDSTGLPVKPGRTTNNNTLVPLVVNCQTTNNFPTGGGGGGLNITDTTTAFQDALYGVGATAANKNLIHSVEVGTSNAINSTLRNPNFPLAVDITRIRGTNVATSPAGVGAHFPVATYTSALNVSGAAVTFPSTMAVTLPVDSNTGVTIPLATTETTPVTTTTITGSVAIQPALDANNVAIPLSVTETNPVSGGGGGGGTSLTQQQVETAMGNALANATGISVTETAPVTAVKITGDETYGIIMSTTFYGTSSPYNIGDYTTIGFGKGASLWQTNVQGVPVPGGNASGPQHTDGWTIRVNGVDIPNQDISFHLRGTNHVPPQTLSNPNYNNATLSTLYPRLIQADSQATIDKYHGRKVTLSGVANVWIVEPLETIENDHLTGFVSARDTSLQHGWTITLTNGVVLENQAISDQGGHRDARTSSNSVYLGSQVIRYHGSSISWLIVTVANP